MVATGVPAASFCGFTGGAAARVAIDDDGGASTADGETSGAAETFADVSLGVSIVDITGAAIGLATERSTGALGGAGDDGATAALVGVTPGSSGELFRIGLASIPAIAAGNPTIDACGILGRIFFRLGGGDLVGSAPGDGDWALAEGGD